MPKKKKGKKEEVEPEHNRLWELATEAQHWIHEPTQLPDAYVWPTWGALRERILHACKTIRCEDTPTVRDAFVSELVRLSPADLSKLSFKGCSSLRKFVLSPQSACPSLSHLNLSTCKSLGHVLIQSMSIQTIDLSTNESLTKVVIYAPNLSQLLITHCPKLHTLVLWSEQVTSLDFLGCPSVASLKLQCDKLDAADVLELPREVMKRPDHEPLHNIILNAYRARAAAVANRRDHERQIEGNLARVPHSYCGMAALT